MPKYSCNSEELIQEVMQDILEFGEEEQVYTWYETFEEYNNAEFIVNYDFIVEGQPLTLNEIQPGERIEILTLKKLLNLLQEQNTIL